MIGIVPLSKSAAPNVDPALMRRDLVMLITA
jgi:hypothetical protein